MSEDNTPKNMQAPHEMQVNMPQDVQGGKYANQMLVTHTQEEFVLDFILATPPAGVVNSRVIVSPGHAKRIANALMENVAKYEAQFGEIKTVAANMPAGTTAH